MTRNRKHGMQDVDIVLTTREMDRLMRMQNINVFSLPEAEFDSPLGIGSGAGVIFGATGGRDGSRTAHGIPHGCRRKRTG